MTTTEQLEHQLAEMAIRIDNLEWNRINAADLDDVTRTVEALNASVSKLNRVVTKLLRELYPDLSGD